MTRKSQEFNHGTTPVKFAVVGCGSIGKRHLALLDANPRAKLVGICDIDEASREAATQQYDVPGFTQYEEMLAHTNPDIVNICTPHTLHAPMSIAAMEFGKHVLVEKPMALNTVQTEQMCETARRQGVQLIVVKQNRYNKPIQLATETLQANGFGKIYMVKCDILWNRHKGYYRESNWRGRRETEGGALYTQGSHFIDLLVWWFGDVKRAWAHTDTKLHDIEVEDCGSAILEFQSGITGYLNWTTCVHRENYEGSITIIGDTGTAKIGGKYLNKMEFWDVEDFPMPEGVEFDDKPNNYGKYQGTSSNHDKVIADVIDRLTGRKPKLLVDGEEGSKAIQAIEMVYEAAKLNKRDGT